ncbi:MAG: hypothetical protein UR25_C0001G0090 [Candidatus Nomurabacteria bacterium GW2011_GWE1_32_28]|uniref:SHS2 domain-containing protein n=1 Tax=Candidatus Nomurabacteria bacterium GW2011_GWF1_31_48 TaxID=1618767 RepID=A0A0F9YGE9_9BACT|nr:MAG: hypothetical protein UR10_C0001G0043 [Candidatus Nomurabacteria bacterium GW2011_GWF2_30_133]KKP28921.1 MAG: hypothetical protein UR18_C0001G0042 [Candidatus Nomurabacteria bacterium GW2011_GWE2_31_40]KKP30659.1 MAG: hypothetical protein UR19_C0001G0043 [Candidatus Nomurabacteria bacterium GW2011_GWF1_31_48]KKP35177.1 MAG: hypothetical protein UR25_C0001G0090 [Candidatus Nomurabacteria bacterium GW2011_GWE1_32_28]HAS80486.1 hypothetical protein [Candidatus Nomurabacteria bacterium]
MGIFFKRKDEKELVLIFDIRSSSVGAAIFEVQKMGVPKIILSIREPIVFQSEINIDNFLFLTIKALEIVASKVSIMSTSRPKKVFCILSSPWYASQTRTIKLEKNTPFVFTSKLANELIKKEISIFEEEHIKNFSDTNNKTRLIEFKNMKTLLNGYQTSDPFNKKTKKLEMIIFISIAGDQILKKIEETIFRHFHYSDVKFSSFAMASFVVARDMFIDQDSFLLVDIGGEVTDISMIKKNILNYSISYPLGYNFIIRRIADSLNSTLDEAKSLISLYRDDHAEESTQKKLEPIIGKLKMEWLKGFQESLVNISSDISIPATIFITVDQDLADFFSKIIKTEQFNQYTLSESEFKIIFLGTQTLNDIIVFKDKIYRDPFIAIEAIYINRFIC